MSTRKNRITHSNEQATGAQPAVANNTGSTRSGLSDDNSSPKARAVATKPAQGKASRPTPARGNESADDLLERVAAMNVTEFGDFISFLSRLWAWKHRT